MTTQHDQESLDILACDYQARPRGAASIFDVAPALGHVTREHDALLLEFAPESVAAVSEFVAAERLCCREIDWTLTLEPAPRLRIAATPAQIDVLQQLFASV